MHPILGKSRRLGLYALSWVPLAALLAYLFKSSGGSTTDTIAMLGVLLPVYATLCLAAWYPCRATPIQTSGFLRLLATHLVAASVVSAVWVAFASGYLNLLILFPRFQHLARASGIYRSLFAIGIFLYLLSVALHYVLAAMEKAHEAEQHAFDARLLARDAELRALKAQINPHFLFNSLHSISALTTIDPPKAREMCITLADFLRSTLGLGEKTLVSLEEELALVSRFLAVEKVRFGSRLQVEQQIAPDTLNLLVPPLLLQPLIENAVGHGIANLSEGGNIVIAAVCQDNRLTLQVENDFDPEYRPKRRTGIGLPNVQDRLTARYGKDAAFDADVIGTRFRVRLTLPIERNVAS